MVKSELTTSQAADRLGVGKSTVNLWCRRGLFPNAHAEVTPRGPVWLIPESDLTGFKPPVMGRPPKSKASGTDGQVTGKASKKSRKGSKR